MVSLGQERTGTLPLDAAVEVGLVVVDFGLVLEKIGGPVGFVILDVMKKFEEITLAAEVRGISASLFFCSS